MNPVKNPDHVNREVWDVQSCTDLSKLPAARHPIAYERAMRALLRMLEASQKELDEAQRLQQRTDSMLNSALLQLARANLAATAAKSIVPKKPAEAAQEP
jgi:hypothetical protein